MAGTAGIILSIELSRTRFSFHHMAAFVFPGIHYANGGRLATNGVDVRLTGRIWKLYFDGTGTSSRSKLNPEQRSHVIRSSSANGGIYFWQKLLNDNLELKIGFRGDMSRFARRIV